MQKSVKITGFSLFELLIALVIIGILAAITIPSYQHHIAKVRRKHAVIILTNTAAKLEHYHTEHGTYLGATLDNIKAKPAEGYKIKLIELTANHFLLEAIPTKNTKHNQKCHILKLDNLDHTTHC